MADPESDRPAAPGPEEWRQIALGVLLFVGSVAAAALLKPLAPWAPRGEEKPSSDDAAPDVPPGTPPA